MGAAPGTYLGETVGGCRQAPGGHTALACQRGRAQPPVPQQTATPPVADASIPVAPLRPYGSLHPNHLGNDDSQLAGHSSEITNQTTLIHHGSPEYPPRIQAYVPLEAGVS